MEFLCFDINVHVPHHVMSKIPWYNLRAATDSLRQVRGVWAGTGRLGGRWASLGWRGTGGGGGGGGGCSSWDWHCWTLCLTLC